MGLHFPVLLSPEALHIPDGFLSVPVAAAGWLVAILVLWTALRKTREALGERQVPILGVLAAFIFAAQAINFPVAGGTSGHLLGGALAALVLGPWPGILVMTSVVSLQGLLFQDGGLLAMGWNIVNMGALTVLTTWLVWRLVARLPVPRRTALLVSGAIGAWLSVEVGAAATAGILAASGTAAFGLAFPAMVGVHALIGAGEAIITLGALSLIQKVRPDLLAISGAVEGTGEAALAAAGLLASLILATLSLAASEAPDGLERVAADQGFLDQALDPLLRIMPDYVLPGMDDSPFALVLPVILGTVLVFGLGLGLAGLLRSKGSGIENGRRKTE